jgi:hypothetical protein
MTRIATILRDVRAAGFEEGRAYEAAQKSERQTYPLIYAADPQQLNEVATPWGIFDRRAGVYKAT